MTRHRAMILRRRVEILLGIGILVAWIFAEFYLGFVFRLISGTACGFVAFYFGWRLERALTRQARIDASLTATFGDAMLKLGAADRLRTAFDRFRKKQESWDKIGRHKVLLSDEISVELGQLSREQKDAASKSSSAA